MGVVAVLLLVIGACAPAQTKETVVPTDIPPPRDESSKAASPQASSDNNTAPRVEAVLVRIVEAAPLAVAKTRAHSQNIGPQIMELLPKVEAHLKTAGFDGHGRAVVVYFDEGDGSFFQPPGLPVEIGFQLDRPLTQESEGVVASTTPAGRVATAAYFGSYDQLGQAHAAVREFCKTNGHAITGRNWEDYGDASDDPAKRRTDVYYLLE